MLWQTKAQYLPLTFILLHILLLLVEQPSLAHGGSILFYMPFVSKSMTITFMPVAERMALRGHEVVVVMVHVTKNPNPKVKHITIEETGFDEMTRTV